MAIFTARMKRMESPQEYVNRIVAEMPNGSHVKVAKRAQALGHKLSAGFVHNVASGVTTNPTIDSVKALAAGLGRPEEEVFAVFRGVPVTEDSGFQKSIFGVMGSTFEVLNAKNQKDLRPTIDMLNREIQRRVE